MTESISPKVHFRMDWKPNKNLAHARLSKLLGTESVLFLHPPDDSGVSAAKALVEGQEIVGYCTEPSIMGGALGAKGSDHIVAAIETAVVQGSPVIGLWHSGGARLADGVESMEGVGRVFAAMTRASGKVPQISVVLGPAAGAAAYGPALTDLVIMTDVGRMFVTGPEIVRAVTGEQVDMESLGGPDSHARKSGVAYVVVGSEDDAYVRARRLADILGRHCAPNVNTVVGQKDLRALLPESSRRAYDVRPLIRELLDCSRDIGFEELQPKWASNIVIGLGRLAGHSVGVVANNPLRKGGCLDSLSAEKASRFVRMCDSQGLPILVVIDVPGYLPGTGQEWGGVIRRGAKLLYAFAEAVVPRISLITRKAYGGAYIAMNSRSLGATAVYAWQGAEVAVMSAESAVGVLYRKQLAEAPAGEREHFRQLLVQEHLRASGGLDRALATGAVDEVIDPKDTVRILAAALDAALAGRPISRGKHGNIPL
jgi:acetyl-CoA/propionyl-CoA carboxylase carboxyl transferase subunit